MLTQEQIHNYHQDGYLIIRSFISVAETDKLYAIALADDVLLKHGFDLNDSSGKRTRLSLWYTPGDDAYGLLTRSRRMVEAVDALMEGNSAVCHFHSKLMQKEPEVGGAWEWHQDYGYWYKNEFLFPGQMMSVMIAVTEATKENGCLEVLKGSHKMGRVEHGFAGEQVGASRRFVDLALQHMEHVYVTLEAGDALFFHSNLLHRSGPNLSDRPRWSLISCYNRQSNVPYNEPSGKSTLPIDVVPDDALMNRATQALSETAVFLEKEKDEALK